MSDMPLVLREEADRVCTLTLNRPDKRNAVNRQLFREFRAHVRDIEENGAEIAVLVITGAGEHFCAGHDLKQAPHADALGWLVLGPAMLATTGPVPDELVDLPRVGVTFRLPISLSAERAPDLPIPMANGDWCRAGACRSASRAGSGRPGRWK